MKILFKMDRETKNTMRFQEEVGSAFDPVNIGTLYVQKGCLKLLGYKEGNLLVMELKVKGEGKDE